MMFVVQSEHLFVRQATVNRHRKLNELIMKRIGASTANSLFTLLFLIHCVASEAYRK